ncbi:response regulator [Halobacteriovorax sp. DPLXC-1]|uniref:response regulator n=1 Tax=Halobacteriovorax sp. DPLXC-1 TaxID=3110771 RepID=UPI002FEFAC4F
MVKIHVLLVDDEEDVYFIFKHVFKDWIKSKKMNLTFSISGEDALNVLKSDEGHDVILILSDINMPGMDGITLLKEVSKRYPNIATIMISGYSSNEYKDKVTELGAIDYFEKPVDFEKLTNLIKNKFPELNDTQPGAA